MTTKYNAEYHREYRKKNKEKNAEYQRKYRKKNKDKIVEYQREYYKNSKEKILNAKKGYRKKRNTSMSKIATFLLDTGWTRKKLAEAMDLSVDQVQRLATDKKWGCNLTPKTERIFAKVEAEYRENQVNKSQ